MLSMLATTGVMSSMPSSGGVGAVKSMGGAGCGAPCVRSGGVAMVHEKTSTRSPKCTQPKREPKSRRFRHGGDGWKSKSAVIFFFFSDLFFFFEFFFFLRVGCRLPDGYQEKIKVQAGLLSGPVNTRLFYTGQPPGVPMALGFTWLQFPRATGKETRNKDSEHQIR